LDSSATALSSQGFAALNAYALSGPLRAFLIFFAQSNAIHLCKVFYLQVLEIISERIPTPLSPQPSHPQIGAALPSLA